MPQCDATEPTPPMIDPVAATALAKSADSLMRDSPVNEVPRHAWPKSIREHNPESVRVDPEGVYLRTGHAFVEAWGIFVLRKDSRFQPTRSGDPSYHPLHDRVYWYQTRG